MAKHVFSGGEGLTQALQAIADRMGKPSVSVGFLEAATYPDGTPVAAVAFWNEYGGRDRPPRPFFRRMIAAESPSWADKVAKLAKATNYDGPRVMALMGEDIKGALQKSINDFTTPALAASTVADKGFAKPLIDTAHMLNSIGYEVK
jgi:hypothetical protein